jgi:hypothetical protein
MRSSTSLSSESGRSVRGGLLGLNGNSRPAICELRGGATLPNPRWGRANASWPLARLRASDWGVEVWFRPAWIQAAFGPVDAGIGTARSGDVWRVTWEALDRALVARRSVVLIPKRRSCVPVCDADPRLSASVGPAARRPRRDGQPRQANGWQVVHALRAQATKRRSGTAHESAIALDDKRGREPALGCDSCLVRGPRRRRWLGRSAFRSLG